MVKSIKIVKKNYKIDKLSVLQYKKASKNLFQNMSDSYYNFLCNYFDINDKGELDGFRFVRRFIEP